MNFYIQNIHDQLSPTSQRCYISLCRKSENLENKLILIEEYKNNLLKTLPKTNDYDKNGLLSSIYEFCEYMYTCMEYTGQIIRDLCRLSIPGEELKDGFNKILEDVLKYKKGTKRSIIFSNMVIRNYILQSQEWYNIIHDIRTEETHYGNGIINFEDNKVFYHNTLRSGKGNLKEISIEIDQFSKILVLYKMYINQLIIIIDATKNVF